MLMYHLWTIAAGETSVEGQDHDVYRKVAKSRGEVRYQEEGLQLPLTIVLFILDVRQFV